MGLMACVRGSRVAGILCMGSIGLHFNGWNVLTALTACDGHGFLALSWAAGRGHEVL